MSNKFKENYNSTVKSLIKDDIQQKGRMDYVSWSNTLVLLKGQYPESSYEVVKYPDEHGNMVKPYFSDGSGFYVTVRLWLTREDRKDGFTHEWTHALLNHSNKPILRDATSQDINKGMQRCLVKLIGIATGLGLSLWTGEDLPEESINDNHQTATQREQSKQNNVVNMKTQQSKQVKKASDYTKEEVDKVVDQIKNAPSKKYLDDLWANHKLLYESSERVQAEFKFKANKFKEAEIKEAEQAIN